MNRRLPPILFTFCAALALTTTSQMALPTAAQAQFTVAEGFDIAWMLDPREHPDQFSRGLGADPQYFGAHSVQVGMDLDGDGMKEILFTTDETVSREGPDPGVIDVFLYEATGDNTYEYVWSYSHVPSNSFPALAYGDIDEDGLNEIYLGIPTIDEDPVDLFIFEQGEDGVFPDAPTVVWDYAREGALDFRPTSFAIADVDGDGQQELITTSRTSGLQEMVVASLTSDGLDDFATFAIEFEANQTILGGGGIYDVDVVDFDNDGNMEIWVNTWDQWSMSVFEATGPDTYELQVDLNQLFPGEDPGTYNRHGLGFVDVDGDDALELYLPMTDGKLYFIDDVEDVSTLAVENVALVGTFSPFRSDTDYKRGGDVGDLDGDGLPEIVSANGVSETVSLIEYDGTGSPADSTSYEWITLFESVGDSTDNYYTAVIADDLDGDGMNEVVFVNRYADYEGQPLLVVLEYTGVGTPNEPNETVPGEYVLAQNYPNPFNPATSIAYTLPSSSQVTIRVYNVMGQVVRTLVDQVQPAGTHHIQWDGRNETGQAVVSGTYLYTLESGDVRQTRRMVLLK